MELIIEEALNQLNYHFALSPGISWIHEKKLLNEIVERNCLRDKK
jgi:hypothetical protein